MMSVEHSTHDSAATSVVGKLLAGKVNVEDLHDDNRRMSEASTATTTYRYHPSFRGSMDLSGFEEELPTKTSEIGEVLVCTVTDAAAPAEVSASAAMECSTPTAAIQVAEVLYVVKFRKDASDKDVKFVEDMDVPVSHIVRAYNLSNRVTWPILKTFCEETVGVPSLDVRMMRRKKPPEARLVFRSEQEAARFLAQVPDKPKLEGRVPKFEHEGSVHKKSPKISKVLDNVQDNVQVAHVSEVGDDCCAKFKSAEKSVEVAKDTQKRRYSVAELLSLRKKTNKTAVPKIDCEETLKSAIALPQDLNREAEPRVIMLRSAPNQNDKSVIKFHQDLDVPEHRVVDAFNLGRECMWPHVNTFVRKVSGITPLAVRMCRRNNMPSAMIMFSTDEEADTFERMIPELKDAVIKGSHPRFVRRKGVAQPAVVRRTSMFADMRSHQLEEGRQLSLLPDIPENVDVARRHSLWADAKLGQ